MEIYEGSKFVASSKEQLLRQCAGLETQGVAPFSDVAMAVLGSLSKRLMGAPKAIFAPQLTALGFWLRPAMLNRMKAEFFASRAHNVVPTPRGVAFHLPPQNVDTLFVYSWALSMLAGNANVVRMPSEMSELVQWLISQVFASLAEHDDAARHMFCRYDHTCGLNAGLSALSDLRMIWGGDAKVLSVSQDPVRPDGLSIGFPDRKSHSVISASAYSELDGAERDKFAERLYNDIYWFDQMGCGSPRFLCWVGDAGELAPDLYTRLDAVTRAKQYLVETGVALRKFAYMNEVIASGLSNSGRRWSNALSVIKAEPDIRLLDDVQGGGMLIEVTLLSLDEFVALVDRRTQTIAHFGFTEDELLSLATQLVSRGGYRIVPVGEALNFSEIWDGLPLLDHMIRQIIVKP